MVFENDNSDGVSRTSNAWPCPEMFMVKKSWSSETPHYDSGPIWVDGVANWLGAPYDLEGKHPIEFWVWTYITTISLFHVGLNTSSTIQLSTILGATTIQTNFYPMLKIAIA